MILYSHLCNCSESAESSSALSFKTSISAVTGQAWTEDSLDLIIFIQATADFLTAETGLHSGTIREGTTAKARIELHLYTNVHR